MKPVEKLLELLRQVELHLGDEPWVTLTIKNKSKFKAADDLLLLEQWNGPLGREVLEYVIDMNKAHGESSAAHELIDKLNSLGQPGPEADWWELWYHKFPNDWTIRKSLKESCFILEIPYMEEGVCGLKTIKAISMQGCAEKACKWAGIELEDSRG